MANFQNLMMGFATVFTLQRLAVCVLGAILGLIVGAMPGIGSLAGCALLLPLTYKFEPTAAIIMLGALYYSNMYGGAFSAILLNVPGDSPAVMTTLDGYPMAKKGLPGQALLTANISSCIGGIIGMIILTFMGPALANFGLKFGPAEMTTLMIMAMTSIGWLLGDNPLKGTISTLIGFVLASIGMDTLTGAPRYNFGSLHLMGGIPFVPFVIGAVGFSQVVGLMMERYNGVEMPKDKLTLRDSLLNKHQLRRLLPPAIRSGIAGTFIGVLPGSGATTASFLGYAMQKGFKSEEPLGTGAIEGVAACESANNAAAAGYFAPLLALGIPGSGTGAVLLGGLMMWGLNPGPLLFTNNAEFAWGLIASLFVANIVALFIAMSIIPHLVKILAVPVKYMIPIITTVCFVGAYATSQSMYGVIVMVLSGVAGYFFKKADLPVAPMLLTFVLSPIFESNMRRAFISSGGSLGIFVGSPLSTAFLVITLLLVCSPAIKAVIGKVRGQYLLGIAHEQTEEWAVEAFRQISDYAAPKGVMIAVENVTIMQTNFINTMAEARRFVELTDRSNFRAMIDVFHLNIEEKDIYQAIRDYADINVHVHLSDNNRRYPGHCGLDFEKIIQTFHDVGYDDLFCTEVFQYPDMEECAKRAIAHLAPIFERVYGRRPRA